jgi:hypothetical protein
MLLDSTRQQFLAAWRAAVPHLSANVASEEITSTTNAMRGLVDLEGNPNDRG